MDRRESGPRKSRPTSPPILRPGPDTTSGCAARSVLEVRPEQERDSYRDEHGAVGEIVDAGPSKAALLDQRVPDREEEGRDARETETSAGDPAHPRTLLEESAFEGEP